MKPNKHTILATTLLSSAVLLAACGNNDETIENAATGECIRARARGNGR